MLPTQFAAVPADAEGDAPLWKMVLFEVGDHRIAIPVEVIREIIPLRSCTPLPGSAPYVLGLINLRGRIVTVVDLGSRLGLAPAAEAADPSVVLVQHGGRSVGIAVAALAGMVEVVPEALAAPAETLRSIGIDRTYLLGMGEAGGELFIAVNTDEILRPLLS
jgi:purine-binding chemotaxis protein CheW